MSTVCTSSCSPLWRTDSTNKSPLCEPLPCNPAGETALHPLIWVLCEFLFPRAFLSGFVLHIFLQTPGMKCGFCLRQTRRPPLSCHPGKPGRSPSSRHRSLNVFPSQCGGDWHLSLALRCGVLSGKQLLRPAVISDGSYLHTRILGGRQVWEGAVDSLTISAS